MKIEDIPVIALGDTGVSHSLLRKSFFDEIKKKYPAANLDVMGSERYTLKSVTEDEIKIRGKLNTNVQITDDYRVNLDMLVINKIPFDVVMLGSNFLHQFESFTINLKSHQVTLKTETRD